ncbi:hypothetical protein M5K25_001016 [Dendrobium thyrsiflorum]|uniref:Uncharacterized protein n=1 Tax=Dendrobium thyrsiflorum TaxID=117978 RepID=A0ABD0WA65_DENTH
MEYPYLSPKDCLETFIKFIGEKVFEKAANKVADIIAKREEEKARIEAVESDLMKLKRTRKRIRALDSDAEQRRYIEDDSVHCWLRDLNSVAFDIEDLNEEFKTHTKGECSRVFDRLYFADRIQEIKEEKDRIDKEKKSLRLRNEEAVRRFKPKTGQDRRQEGSLQDDRRFHGRQKETEEVVAELLKFKGGDGVQVISIVGCCGSGKTSLARNILKDARFENHFNPRIWVSLSENYDLVRTIKEVIKAVSEGRECHDSTLDLLQHHLKRIISNKRFLLVLDNMWSTDFDFLEKLRTPLMFAAEGSKILVTTQNEEVANRMQTEYTLRLQGLPEDDGWLLFQDVVFTEDSELEAIGREIVKKCHGFPLAIKAISSLLCSETNPDQWKLLSDELLENEEAAAAIIQSLKISYDHLPLYLKHCFAFCSTFPKDYEFDKDELVRLWMATKLIKSKRRSMQFEDIGERYFDNLLKRSFFQASDSNINDSRKYKMPSLIHEVVHLLYIRHESLRVNQDETIHGESGRARYGLLYQPDKQSVKFDKMFKNKGLRALMLYGKNGELLKDNLIDLFEKLRFLRLLDLSSSCLEDLPDSVCNLILLRYLSLHGTNIKRLPETIGKLYHLQTLQLGNCIKIHELPDSIGDLKFLRHLGLHNTSIRMLPETVSNLLNLQTLELGNCYKLEMLPKSLKNLVHLRHLGLQLDWDSWDRQIDINSMPPGIRGLKFLRHLSRFAVGSEPECGLGELKDLNLRGKLCITKLEKVVRINDAEGANLSGKRYIDSLMLRWSDAAFTESENLSEDVIDQLQPHENLKHLCVENYNGKEFPNWIGDPSFLKLEKLELINCKLCSSLPSVWNLPSLKTLHLKSLHGVKNFGATLSGFENLETLHLSDMPNLESWFIGAGLLSCLTALYVSDCPNLEWPSYLPSSIKTFEWRNCQKFSVLNNLPNLQDLVLESDRGSRLIWVQHLTSLTSLTLSKLSVIQDACTGIFKCLTSLKKLKVQECNDLDSIDGLTNHYSLEYLEISSCSQLTKIDLPKKLEELRLYLCPRLESLPGGLHLLSSLRVVEIHSVSLASMPKLPDGVKTLVIKECSMLRKRCQENGYEEFFPAMQKKAAVKSPGHMIKMKSTPLLLPANYSQMDRVLDVVGGKIIEKAIDKFSDIYSKREAEEARLQAVESDLQKLNSTRERILALLSDAEERRYIEDDSVHRWLRDLKAVAFDTEDVYEEFHIYKTLSETPIDGRGNCWRKFDRRDFADRIQKITEEYDRVVKGRKDLRLQRGEAVRRSNPQRGQYHRQEGSLQDDERFHGREEGYNGVATMDRRRRLEDRDEVQEGKEKKKRHSSQAILKPAGPSDLAFFDLGLFSVPSSTRLEELWTFAFWAAVGLCSFPFSFVLSPPPPVWGSFGPLCFGPPSACVFSSFSVRLRPLHLFGGALDLCLLGHRWPVFPFFRLCFVPSPPCLGELWTVRFWAAVGLCFPLFLFGFVPSSTCFEEFWTFVLWASVGLCFPPFCFVSSPPPPVWARFGPSCFGPTSAYFFFCSWFGSVPSSVCGEFWNFAASSVSHCGHLLLLASTAFLVGSWLLMRSTGVLFHLRGGLLTSCGIPPLRSARPLPSWDPRHGALMVTISSPFFCPLAPLGVFVRPLLYLFGGAWTFVPTMVGLCFSFFRAFVCPLPCLFWGVWTIVRAFSGLCSSSSRAAHRLQQWPIEELIMVSSTMQKVRQEEKKKLFEELLNFSCSDNVQVISIVGSCGSGKTSLARNIFRVVGLVQKIKDGCSKSHFDLRIWVSLSPNFDLAKAIKEVIKAVERRECHDSSLDLLQYHLKNIITGKRFLLVLDNMWRDDFDFWENLRTPLMDGAEGSKILVTTQNENVARNMQTVHKSCLQGLPVNDGWLLLQDLVFSKDERIKVFTEQPELEVIGKDIVKECQGFPLAIKAIGSLLYSERDEKQWELLSEELMENGKVAGTIIPFLKTSYDHLPLHLKHCFAFCSTFPKDYEFGKEELVKLWIAMDLVKKSTRIQIEDTGERYFDDLLWRSFFQACDSSMKDRRMYKMPTVIHELAHHLFRYESLRINQDVIEHGESGTAHYGLVYQHDKLSVTFNKMFENKGLRALVLCGRNGVLMKEVLIDLFDKLRFLRLLDLNSSFLEELPDSVCNLILLRYLSLHGTNIKKLPDTVGNLYSLQTLELGSCHQIQELPDSIGDLKYLRHLGLHNTNVSRLPETVSNLLNLQTLELGNCYRLEMLPRSLKKLVHLRHLGLQLDWDSWDRQIDIIAMPPGIRCLTSLRHLSRFAVGSEAQCGLGELKDLKLRGKLCITKLENVISVNDAEAANLSGKRYIDSLMLRWSDSADKELKNVPEDVIDRLQPHKNLQNLYVENYNGKEFPNWMRDPSFLKLETLKLINCKICSSLPCVWKLPSLKTLQIKGLHGVERFGTVLSGFENLETLDVSDMHNLKSWFLIRDDRMSCLTALYISDCPNLKWLSYLPPSIKTFELRNCPKLGVLNILPNLQDLVLESDSGSRLEWVQNLTSLTSLTLSKLSQIQDDHKRIFTILTSLKRLKVQECYDLDSIDGFTNNSSLEYLEISSCPELTTMDLPKKLKELRLHCCRKLELLTPELYLLSSLRVIEIHSVSLASIARLPACVENLVIKECSVLSKRCQKNGGDWLNIKHIPYIKVDQTEYRDGISLDKHPSTLSQTHPTKPHDSTVRAHDLKPPPTFPLTQTKQNPSEFRTLTISESHTEKEGILETYLSFVQPCLSYTDRRLRPPLYISPPSTRPGLTPAPSVR